ncbi:MAG TPA: extracellular solute-binding protein [Gaiellaceae bacterium]
MKSAPGLAFLLIVGALAGCGGGGTTNTITLYNGQHPQLTQALVSAFEKKTGIHVRVRTNDGIVLASQILQEGSHSPADVYIAENSPELEALSEQQKLAALPTSLTSQIPTKYNSPTGTWIGQALRVSALVYNPGRISAAQLPKRSLDLAQPEWKGKLALAPTDSDFPPIVGAAIAENGTAATANWLRGLKSNAVVYPDEEAVVSAVERGDQAVGLVNQYYWYRLQLEQGASHTTSRLYFFPNHDVGSVVNVGGAGVLASSKNKPDAEAFLRFLVSAQGQRILAHGDDFEYPTRPGIAPNPALPPLSQLDPDSLSVAKLGDDQQSVQLIQQSGLG